MAVPKRRNTGLIHSECWALVQIQEKRCSRDGMRYLDGIDETREKLMLQSNDLYWVWREFEPEFERLMSGYEGGVGVF